jgi:hypothetical protein
MYVSVRVIVNALEDAFHLAKQQQVKLLIGMLIQIVKIILVIVMWKVHALLLQTVDVRIVMHALEIVHLIVI